MDTTLASVWNLPSPQTTNTISPNHIHTKQDLQSHKQVNQSVNKDELKQFVKTSKDTTENENYRKRKLQMNSLGNTDAKIVNKIVANQI